MSDAILQVSNLEKQFRVGQGKILRAVDNVSFTIQRGKTLGLVGQSPAEWRRRPWDAPCCASMSRTAVPSCLTARTSAR